MKTSVYILFFFSKWTIDHVVPVGYSTAISVFISLPCRSIELLLTPPPFLSVPFGSSSAPARFRIIVPFTWCPAILV